MTDLIVEIIGSYNEYLSKLPNGCLFIAEKLREDQIQEALNNIKNFSEGLIWLVDASELLKKNDIVVNMNVERVHEYLNEINYALEIQDNNLVADLFEYELVEFFKDSELIIIEQ
ncbi:hypothetical protein BK128_04270 [Viridibacillus sp. FSL H7-0596]|nr:hypothetical protein BK128_04270 [Viridibacillus sp. FSL H7-0596]